MIFFLDQSEYTCLLSSGISFSVVTSPSITSWKCLFHIKNRTWKCCGNSLADPKKDTVCPCFRHKILVASIMVEGHPSIPCVGTAAAPWGACFRGLLYDRFTTRRLQRESVPIVWAVDVLARWHGGIYSQWAKHVQGIFNLRGKLVP